MIVSVCMYVGVGGYRSNVFITFTIDLFFSDYQRIKLKILILLVLQKVQI